MWQRIPMTGIVRNTAGHCCLDHIEGSCYYFTLDAAQANLFNPSHAEKLGNLLQKYLGFSCEVIITVGTPQKTTPNQLQQQKQAQRLQEAEDSFRSDPNVIALLQQFEADIREGSIEPFQPSIH
ncbi:MAG: DNA polymerase III subunit gamma/tau C-terminal domain-containing protein [Pseudomonadales bacterium]